MLALTLLMENNIPNNHSQIKNILFGFFIENKTIILKSLVFEMCFPGQFSKVRLIGHILGEWRTVT